VPPRNDESSAGYWGGLGGEAAQPTPLFSASTRHCDGD